MAAVEPIAISSAPEGAYLHLRITPRASRTELQQGGDGALRLRVAAPPVDGEANAEVVRYLAKLLGVPKSRLELAAGHSGRSKKILVRGMSAETLAGIIAGVLS